MKDKQTLLSAYDDASGVTAAFNKNILTRINRELGANFNPRLFRHRARWNEDQSRIEIYLESLIAQYVTIPSLELAVRFARGRNDSYRKQLQVYRAEHRFHRGTRRFQDGAALDG